MKTTWFFAVLVAAQFASTVSAVTIDMVTVGNPGNAPDSKVMFDGTTGYGSVGYIYQIGKYEVTAGQYTEFLNSVAATDPYYLYDPLTAGPGNFACRIRRTGSPGEYRYSVPADWANRPVNYVRYWDAARFVNWLGNGQPATGVEDVSTTEDGTYTLKGYNDADGSSITRNPGAKFWIPSEDEWYKAAYHKNDGVTGDYWDYPTRSNTPPINTLPDSGNHASFRDDDHTGNGTFTIGDPYDRTEVGAFKNSAGPYGTFDQGGNVSEWNDAIFYRGLSVGYRGSRGGSWDGGPDDLSSSFRVGTLPVFAYELTGFRVAGSVPEPNSFALATFALLALLVRRRRLTTP